MKPKFLVLIRHGKSEGNANKEIYKVKPDYTLRLTEEGVGQAKKAGQQLRFLFGSDSVKFYISPFWRTRETYHHISKSFSKPSYYEDPRLREQEWNGKMPTDGFREQDEKERDSFGHFYYRFEGGESCGDVYDRISSFLDTLHRDFEKENFPDNCVIVTHGMTMRVFLMRWLHLSVEEFELLANPGNGEYYVLQLTPTGRYEMMSEPKKYKKRSHEYQFNWNELS